MTRSLILAAAALVSSLGLSGCIVLSAADAAVDVTAATVKTGAKVIGGTADVLTTSDQEACVKELNRRGEDTRPCYER